MPEERRARNASGASAGPPPAAVTLLNRRCGDGRGRFSGTTFSSELTRHGGHRRRPPSRRRRPRPARGPCRRPPSPRRRTPRPPRTPGAATTCARRDCYLLPRARIVMRGWATDRSPAARSHRQHLPLCSRRRRGSGTTSAAGFSGGDRRFEGAADGGNRHDG
jgi:hypothetical protein